MFRGALKHKLLRVDNYQAEPKPSGYRGIHLIYRYRSNKSETYNGLLLEVQIRSPLQHAWATAVETVGTFLKQSLKGTSKNLRRSLTDFEISNRIGSVQYS
ncbi:RelA/SpoT domain-containing protein [Cyanobium sp. ULC082]